MSDTFSIQVDGFEIARVTGDVQCGKRLDGPEFMGGKFVDDPKLLRISHNGKAAVIIRISAAGNVTVKKVEGAS